MIQRIQSLYLLIVAGISVGLMFAFNLGEVKLCMCYSIGVYIASGLSALLALIAIFSFKNRKSQFVLGRLNIILNFFLLGFFVYLSLNLSGEASASEKGIWIYLPIVSIVFLALANKAIKKDEDLVKSVDRLR